MGQPLVIEMSDVTLYLTARQDDDVSMRGKAKAGGEGGSCGGRPDCTPTSSIS